MLKWYLLFRLTNLNKHKFLSNFANYVNYLQTGLGVTFSGIRARLDSSRRGMSLLCFLCVLCMIIYVMIDSNMSFLEFLLSFDGILIY